MFEFYFITLFIYLILMPLIQVQEMLYQTLKLLNLQSLMEGFVIL